MQLNCHKFQNVHTSLEADTPATGLYIYFLQETYNHLRNPCGLTKYFLHYLPDTNCRAAIYAPPELGLTFHPNLSSRDCATASVTIEGERVYFSSVYLDIRLTVEEPAWLLTLNKASSTRRHFLAGNLFQFPQRCMGVSRHKLSRFQSGRSTILIPTLRPKRRK
jgi:hypothetical protein